MKKLPLPLVTIGAPIIVAVFAYLVYVVFSYLISPEVAGTVAGTILTSSVASVYKYLKDKEIKLSFLATNAGAPAEKLVLKWPVMLLYGTLILFGTIEIFGGLQGLLSGYYFGGDQISLLTIVVLNSFLIWPIFAFVLGRWVGRKCDRFGAFIIPVIIIIVYIANILTTFMLPDSVIAASLNQTKAELLAGVLSQEFLFTFAIPSIILQTLSGLLGFWRGYRTRSSDRVLDLMGVLPPSTRSTFVDLIYEEAQKVLAVPR